MWLLQAAILAFFSVSLSKETEFRLYQLPADREVRLTENEWRELFFVVESPINTTSSYQLRIEEELLGERWCPNIATHMTSDMEVYELQKTACPEIVYNEGRHRNVYCDRLLILIKGTAANNGSTITSCRWALGNVTDVNKTLEFHIIVDSLVNITDMPTESTTEEPTTEKPTTEEPTTEEPTTEESTTEESTTEEPTNEKPTTLILNVRALDLLPPIIVIPVFVLVVLIIVICCLVRALCRKQKLSDSDSDNFQRYEHGNTSTRSSQRTSEHTSVSIQMEDVAQLFQAHGNDQNNWSDESELSLRSEHSSEHISTSLDSISNHK